MQPPARCSNYRCVYINQCGHTGVQFTTTERPKQIILCPTIFGGASTTKLFWYNIIWKFLGIPFLAILFLIHSHIKTFQKDLPTLLQHSLMFNVKISQCTKCRSSYDFASVWATIHSLKLIDYPPVQTHKPYNNIL